MRRLLLLALLTLVLLPAPPAQAKGPTAVDVAGPGVHVRLHYGDPVAEADLWRLGEAAQMPTLYGAGPLRGRPGLTPEALGPRFVLTWRQLSQVVFVQHAYPFAEGGAWVHVPSNQPLRYDGTPVPTGWISAEDQLRRILVRHGAAPPVADDVGAVTLAPERRVSPAVEPSKSAAPSAYLMGSFAACALVGILAALRLRRQRSR
jgi:hypothetical protein